MAESLVLGHVARPLATQRQRADGCLGSRGKEHTEIEIATFRDQEQFSRSRLFFQHAH